MKFLVDIIGINGDFSGNLTVADQAYGPSWNGSLQVPTKNAVYDKIEAINPSGTYLPLAGGIMSGAINLNGQEINAGLKVEAEVLGVAGNYGTGLTGWRLTGVGSTFNNSAYMRFSSEQTGGGYTEEYTLRWGGTPTSATDLIPKSYADSNYSTAAHTHSLTSLTDTTITSANKGDLLVHNGTSWVDLSIGANESYLIADSTTATGVKWAPAIGFVTLTGAQEIGGAKTFLNASIFQQGLVTDTTITIKNSTTNFGGSNSALFADATGRIGFKQAPANNNVESTVFDFVNITGHRVVTFPDKSGTVAMLDDISGGGVTDHGALTGLADNDHPQYVLKAGDTMTGNLKFNDSVQIQLGTDADVQFNFNGSDTFLNFENTSPNFYLRNSSINRFTFGTTSGNFTATGTGVFGGAFLTLNNGTTYGQIEQKRTVSAVEYTAAMAVAGGTGHSVFTNFNGTTTKYYEVGGADPRYYDGTSAHIIWHANNDGAGSGLDADLFRGRTVTSTGNRFDVIPYVASDGVMEVGSIIDFHNVDGDTGDFTWGRITGGTTDFSINRGLISTGDILGINVQGTTSLTAGNATTTGTISVFQSDAASNALSWEDNYCRFRRSGGGTSAGWRWDNFDSQNMRLAHDGTLTLGVDAGSGGSGNLKANDVNINSTAYWRVSSTNAASQRSDARVDNTDESRLHWYGLNTAQGTECFRHAWYDGASYVEITALSNNLTFEKTSTALTFHLKARNDASLIVEADSGNVTETDNPTIEMWQDGALVKSIWGISGATNTPFTGAINNSPYFDTLSADGYVWGINSVLEMKLTSTQLDLGTNSLKVDGHTLSNSTDRSGLLLMDGPSGASWYGPQIRDDGGQLWSLMGNAVNMGLYDDTNGEWVWLYTKDGNLQLYHGNATTASIVRLETTVSGVTVTGSGTATDWINTSDIRLKDNPRNLDIDPVKVPWKMWEWKDSGKTSIGVIAQELEVTHPEFVSEDENGMKSVSYTQLLVAKNAELEKRIERLEKLIEKML